MRHIQPVHVITSVALETALKKVVNFYLWGIFLVSEVTFFVAEVIENEAVVHSAVNWKVLQELVVHP